MLHALSGQWLCWETKGAGFGWDFEEELHRYSFPQGRCCMAHSHESVLSAVPGTGMSHVTPRINRCIWHRRVAQTANFGSGAFKHLEEEILKADVEHLPNKQSKLIVVGRVLQARAAGWALLNSIFGFYPPCPTAAPCLRLTETRPRSCALQLLKPQSFLHTNPGFFPTSCPGQTQSRTESSAQQTASGVNTAAFPLQENIGLPL